MSRIPDDIPRNSAGFPSIGHIRPSNYSNEVTFGEDADDSDSDAYKEIDYPDEPSPGDEDYIADGETGDRPQDFFDNRRREEQSYRGVRELLGIPASPEFSRFDGDAPAEPYPLPPSPSATEELVNPFTQPSGNVIQEPSYAVPELEDVPEQAPEGEELPVPEDNPPENAPPVVQLSSDLGIPSHLLVNNPTAFNANQVHVFRRVIPCPTAGDQSEAVPVTMLCQVCMVNQINTVLEPCGHGCMCGLCAEDYVRREVQCPMCRRPILRVNKLFVSAEAHRCKKRHRPSRSSSSSSKRTKK